MSSRIALLGFSLLALAVACTASVAKDGSGADAGSCPSKLPSGTCDDATHSTPADTCFYTLPTGCTCDTWCAQGTWVSSCTACSIIDAGLTD